MKHFSNRCDTDYQYVSNMVYHGHTITVTVTGQIHVLLDTGALVLLSAIATVIVLKLIAKTLLPAPFPF